MPKHAITNRTLVEPMYTVDTNHRQIHFSVETDRSVCISLREYISSECGNPKHLLCRRTSVWIFDTSSHKHVIFLSSCYCGSMFCLTILPFVEPDGDKWIQTLTPRQCVGNMRDERKYINDKHTKSST